MMMKLIWIIMTISSIMAMKSNNALKMSFFILISTIMIFGTTNLITGQSWIITMMLMLFVGGILMMFMMLTSILPNEKSLKMKMKKKTWISLTILSFILMGSKAVKEENTASQMKALMSSGVLFMFLTITVLTYFLLSMKMASSEEYSMRSLSC